MTRNAFIVTAYGAALLLAGVAVYAAIKGGSSAVKKGLAAIDPTNPDNLAASLANWAVQKVTGDPNTSTGSAAYDFLHPNEGAKLVAPTIVTRDANGKVTAKDAPVPNYGQQVLQDLSTFMY